jgi:hypothetical protein
MSHCSQRQRSAGWAALHRRAVVGHTAVVVVRISKGTFPPDRLDDAERALAASEAKLRDVLEQMPGLVHYYVGIDRDAGQLTNTSVWDNLEHATAMSSLAPMLAQRPVLEAAGVTFELITNHDTLWSITA